ncbi:MAG TPA: hypothetical protein VML54_04720, partial [Candidatus Limnocylindrales bacterium]|nr:hypothetical protein [Candidatus Limnocylindrales bacterium]
VKTRRVLGLAGLLGVLACGEERERPLPTGPSHPADLTVELLAPQRDQTVVAGTIMSVRVRGREPSALLAALGFYAVRIGPDRPVVDSALVALRETRDTTLTFDFVVPDSLPQNAQIELIGVAVGRAAERVVTEGRGIVIIACTPGATFC